MNAVFSARAILLQELCFGPGYGSDLAKRVADRTGYKVTLWEGSVYPALSSLARDGLAKRLPVDRPEVKAEVVRGRTPKRYEISAAGRAIAKEHQAAAMSLFVHFA